MKTKWIILISLAFLSLFACARTQSESGTNDPEMDAELRAMKSHEEQMEALMPVIDSLACISPRTEEQEKEYKQVLNALENHQLQWEEARRRAAERAKGDWNRVCPFKRSSGFDCVEGR